MEPLVVAPALLRKKFYPVIHCIDPFRKGGIGHTLINTRAAIENGADGVFLIGHDLPFTQLTHLYDYVRKQFPDIWIGVNFLDLGSKKNWVGLETVAQGCVGLNALWIDTMPTYRLALPQKIQVFGGVAFKYIAPDLSDEALVEACQKARGRVDIATTSGERTGVPPSIQKLVSIRTALRGEMPLAVASGVTEKNVGSLYPYVDIFLVSSSISAQKPVSNATADYFVPDKVRALADVIHKEED